MAHVLILLSLFALAGCGENALLPTAPSSLSPTTVPKPASPPPLSLYFSAMTPNASPDAPIEAVPQSAISALDANTGKLRWTYITGAQVQNVPVVDHDTLYVGADNQTVYALNAGNGSVRWKASVGGEPHVITVQNGLVYGDIALNSGGRSTLGPIFALDARNGSIAWRSQINGSFFGLIHGVVYVATADNKLYALDAAHGSARWQFQMDYPFAGLKVVAEQVYLLAAHRASDAPNVVLYVLNASTGALQWRYPAARKDLENLDLIDADNGALYLLASGQQNLAALPLALALNASDGSVLWQYQASGKSSSFTSSTLDNGTLYLGTTTGQLLALSEQDGLVRWHTKITSTMNIDLVHDGAIYLTLSNEGVTALKTSSGAVLWRYRSADYVGISSAKDAALYGFSVSSSFDPDSHNYVLALNANNGSLLWSYDAGTGSIFPVLS
jgi:outer membrane protein assembly factor BamB